MSGSESSSPAKINSKSPPKRRMDEDSESPESKQDKAYADALKLEEACPDLVKRAEEKYNFKLLDRSDGYLMSAKVSLVIQKEREELGLDKECDDEEESSEKSPESEEDEEEGSDDLGPGFDFGSCGSSYASTEEEEELGNDLIDDARSIDDDNDDPEEDGGDASDP